MRLQRSSSPEPETWLEYSGNVVPTDEEHIAKVTGAAIDDIAVSDNTHVTGSGKGVSDTPLTLHVKKADVPDLTMVDLPGITRVPVNGQPEDIYEQISGMIMKYIEPQESIILNVLSATVDFTTCESIRMSRQVDKTGERTLAAVTKADKPPEGLPAESNCRRYVSIRLGYVCVRNRIGEETYQKARREEEILFSTYPLLSMIDDEIVGIPVLANRLIQIQASMITLCLPEIERKINEKMEISVLELNKLPMIMASTEEALMALMDIIDNLQTQPEDLTEFLMDEIKILDECKCVGLPNFLPRSAFMAILSQHVDRIHAKPVKFIKEIWDYIEVVLSSVITKYSDNFPQIQSSIKRAGRNLITKMKEQSVERVMEILGMEKITDYTCNPEYMTSWTQKTGEQESFINAVLKDGNKPEYSLTGFEDVKISHLRKYHAHLHTLLVKLNNSIKLLKESKDVVAAIVDQNSGYGLWRTLASHHGNCLLNSGLFLMFFSLFVVHC
ncbi:unnamed protein product [Arabidopsis halleri]